MSFLSGPEVGFKGQILALPYGHVIQGYKVGEIKYMPSRRNIARVERPENLGIWAYDYSRG